MTSRSSFASKRRPLSAIFLGDGPTSSSTSELPDLPEPPSPGAASTHSGLPSPPATNSTGSGSTGDSREAVDLHSVSPPSSALTMRNERQSISRSSRASSPAGSGEYRREEGDEEEDTTARLNLGRRRGASQSNEHVVTLQRVMSLTQRNRMALNKLSSMRLNTPSPSQSSRSSRSPRLPPGASTSNSSMSASVSNRSRSVEPATLSGSETEREPSAAYSYSSDDQSITPPSSVSHAYSVLDGRLRRTSLPASPSKGRTAPSTRSYSPNSTQRTPKKRISTMSVPDPNASREYEQNNATFAALASVASLRRSPGSSGKKNRQPLPREFREPRRTSSDGRASKEPTTPQKPSRERYSSLISDTSPSRTFVRRALNNQQSPPRSSQISRLSSTRKHATRWMSEDLRTTSSRSIVDDNEDDDPLSSGSDHGNRQAARSGAIENSPSARLVGESLRAAGVKVKNNGVDVFHESEHPPEKAKGPRRPTPISTASSQEREGIISPNKGITPLRTVMADDPRTPANGSSLHRAERATYSGPQSRPATSMADFRPINEDLPPNTAPAAVRTYKTSFTDRDHDREGMVSRQALYTPFSTAPKDRTYGSPRTRPRETPALPLDEQALEHLRLMDESLTMFEGQLSRLPPMGDTSTTTVPEVFRNAQAVVRFSEQVNGMLRTATNRALDRLIETEVSDASPNSEVDMVGLWKDIGGDFRDMLRVSDELVRTMTGFLLGAGKVLRESSAIGLGAGSTLQHLRGASDDLSRRSGTDSRSSTSAGTGSGRGSGSGDGIGGRRSTELRRSWDLPRVERDKADLLRRASSRVDANVLSSQRAPSSMLLRERDPPRRQSPLGPTEDVLPASARAPVGSSVRRLFTPGPQREKESTPSASAKPELATIESQKSLHIEDDYVPSPSPAPHSRQPDGNTRKLQPLSIPNPIPALPSESRADQQPFPSTVDKPINRRRISTASTVTLRGSTSVNPGLNITTPSAAPTTAVTPHTATPVVPPPVSRTESSQSSSSASSKRHSTTVTFSRPSAVSVSALSGLQQRDARNRTTSVSNEGPAPTPTTPLSATSPWTPQSGSETERPQPRMTLGRRTIGAKSHLSLDAPPPGGGTQTLTRSTAKERRRTITEIFS